MSNSILNNVTTRNWLDELDQFEAPFLEEKMVSDGVFSSNESFREAFREFKRFVAVCVLVSKDVSMTSDVVEAVWHQFILFTTQYHAFCNRFVSGYLHFVPENSHAETERTKTFSEGYEAIFGPLSRLWSQPNPSCPGSSPKYGPNASSKWWHDWSLRNRSAGQTTMPVDQHNRPDGTPAVETDQSSGPSAKLRMVVKRD